MSIPIELRLIITKLDNFNLVKDVEKHKFEKDLTKKTLWLIRNFGVGIFRQLNHTPNIKKSAEHPLVYIYGLHC